MSQAHLVIAQLIVSLLMTGVIWVVQLVIYPLFQEYGKRAEKHDDNLVVVKRELQWLHDCYTPKISLVVIPLMFSELGLAVYHTITKPSPFSFVGLSLVVGSWLSTFFLSVPLHQRIAESQDFKSTVLLVRTNWPRVLLWTGRSTFLLWWGATLQ